MSRDLSHYFSCETYLIAYAGGSRDGFVRDHVDTCSFCDAIVYGGTDEFPQSFVEEVAEFRAERQRLAKTASRRRFFKIGAAAILGIASIGATGVVASKYFRNRVVVNQRSFEQRLDQAYAASGDGFVAQMLDTGSDKEILKTMAWISDRHHTSLLGFVIQATISPVEEIHGSAVACLLKFPRQTLSPFKSSIASASQVAPNAKVRSKLQYLLNQIP